MKSPANKNATEGAVNAASVDNIHRALMHTPANPCESPRHEAVAMTRRDARGRERGMMMAENEALGRIFLSLLSNFRLSRLVWRTASSTAEHLIK
jgi:hypothetical protein